MCIQAGVLGRARPNRFWYETAQFDADMMRCIAATVFDAERIRLTVKTVVQDSESDNCLVSMCRLMTCQTYFPSTQWLQLEPVSGYRCPMCFTKHSCGQSVFNTSRFKKLFVLEAGLLSLEGLEDVTENRLQNMQTTGVVVWFSDVDGVATFKDAVTCAAELTAYANTLKTEIQNAGELAVAWVVAQIQSVRRPAGMPHQLTEKDIPDQVKKFVREQNDEFERAGPLLHRDGRVKGVKRWRLPNDRVLTGSWAGVDQLFVLGLREEMLLSLCSEFLLRVRTTSSTHV